MNPLMNKYMTAFTSAQGTEVEKVKHVIMHYARTWEWDHQDSLVADLLDDQNITADDIVDFLVSTYEMEGGNREFSCAVKAMQVCLHKGKLQDAKNVKEDVTTFEDNERDEMFDGSNYFIPGLGDFLKHQPLSH